MRNSRNFQDKYGHTSSAESEYVWGLSKTGYPVVECQVLALKIL